MSDCDRILRALQRGPVIATDFTPPTVDGGKPVMRVAARIRDLKEAGHKIVSERAANGLALYTLVREATSPGETTATAPQAGSTIPRSVPDHTSVRPHSRDGSVRDDGTVPGLFDVPPVKPARPSHFDLDEAA